MVKKIVSKKKKFNKLWIAIIVLLFVQVVTIWYFMEFETRYNKSTSPIVADLLLSKFESSRYKDPVIDITENRVYIPEARAYVPLNETSRDMVYRYQVHDSKKDPIIYLFLSMRNIVGNQKFSDSHEDSTCDRMVMFTELKEGGSSTYRIVDKIKSDFDFKYIHQHRDCSIYPKGVMDNLVEVAKSIKSY